MTTTPTLVRPWLLTSLALSTLLPSLSTSIANVALPTLTGAFGASFSAVQWVVIAYLLAVTTVVVGAGRLGDIAGRRRLLLWGIAVYTVGSLLCGLAPNLPLLVAARAVQGVGAAGMMALSMAFVGETVPRERTGRVMGLLGTMSAVGTALGPAVGGFLVAGFGWRSIFLIGVPLGMVAFVSTARLLPAVAPAGRQRFDTAGMLLLAFTLVVYALAMTVEGALPGLLTAAVAGLVVFVAVERRVRDPLVRLSMLREPALAAGLTTSAVVSAVMMATLVVGPFHLSRALGLDAVVVGLVMSAGPVVSALAGVPAGRAADRFGSRAVVTAGLCGVVVGALGLALTPAPAGVAGYVVPLVVTTASYATFQAANNTAVMRDVPQGRRGLVSGLLNLSRNLGLVTGASAMGAVFAAAAGDLATAGPAQVAAGTRWTFTVGAALVAAGLAAHAVLRRR